MTSEAVVASEAVKKGLNHKGNMHMYKKVIEVTDFESEVRSNLVAVWRSY